MKRLCIIIIGVLLTATASSQPSWTKKAAKSVFTLKTFSADGTLIGSTNGFFTGEDGEAVSSFSPFKGASSAVVIDAQGKELPVACMLGANETYDVAKFRVAAKKTVPLTIAAFPYISRKPPHWDTQLKQTTLRLTVRRIRLNMSVRSTER